MVKRYTRSSLSPSISLMGEYTALSYMARMAPQTELGSSGSGSWRSCEATTAVSNSTRWTFRSGWHAPVTVRRRHHIGPDRPLPLIEDLKEGLAIESQTHGAAQLRIVKGRSGRIDEQCARQIPGLDFADRLRRLSLEILQCRDAHIQRNHVKLPGKKGQVARTGFAHDRVFDAVEVRPARFPVMRVFRHFDLFVMLERDEFERAGTDRMLAHLARRHMAGIDR